MFEIINSDNAENVKKNFMAKVYDAFASAGKAVIRDALALYYAAWDPDTPAWAKTVIFSALLYFICPMDVIPDFLPGGYADDSATLAAAIATVAAHVKPSHRQKAQQLLESLF
ncbi:MAG: DUF1232 domain-containing protein [Planctomycetota bacterium]|nr:DUF1232 domain-containing protein [Planctomycetota bacterium]